MSRGLSEGAIPRDRKDIPNIESLACRKLASAPFDGCLSGHSAVAPLSFCFVECCFSPIEHVLHGLACPQMFDLHVPYPTPREMGCQNAQDFAGVIPNGGRHIDVLHRFAGRIRQKLCKQNGLVGVSDAILFDALLEVRARRHVGAEQDLTTGGGDNAIRVNGTDSGQSRVLQVQLIEDFLSPGPVPDGADFGKQANLAGAECHVGIEFVCHLKSCSKQSPADLTFELPFGWCPHDQAHGACHSNNEGSARDGNNGP